MEFDALQLYVLQDISDAWRDETLPRRFEYFFFYEQHVRALRGIIFFPLGFLSCLLSIFFAFLFASEIFSHRQIHFQRNQVA